MTERPQSLDFCVELIKNMFIAVRININLVDNFASAGFARCKLDAAMTGGGGSYAKDFAEFVFLVQFGFGVLATNNDKNRVKNE
jgi:hypothetical protein